MRTRIRIGVLREKDRPALLESAILAAPNYGRYLGHGIAEIVFTAIDEPLRHLASLLEEIEPWAADVRVDAEAHEFEAGRLFKLNRSARGAGLTEADARRSRPSICSADGTQSYRKVFRRTDIRTRSWPELRSSNEILVEFVATPRGVSRETELLPFIRPVARTATEDHSNLGFLSLCGLPGLEVEDRSGEIGPGSGHPLVLDVAKPARQGTAFASKLFTAYDGTSYTILEGTLAARLVLEWRQVGFTPVISSAEWRSYASHLAPVARGLGLTPC